MMCSFERCGEKNGRPVCCCTRPGCGRKAYSDDPATCFAECGVRGGWGSLLAKGLARGYIVPFVKINPAGYRRFKVRWGFTDACRCADRKIKLNRLGRCVAIVRRKLIGRLCLAASE